jgi:hypothetical protein
MKINFLCLMYDGEVLLLHFDPREESSAGKFGMKCFTTFDPQANNIRRNIRSTWIGAIKNPLYTDTIQFKSFRESEPASIIHITPLSVVSIPMHFRQFFYYQ